MTESRRDLRLFAVIIGIGIVLVEWFCSRFMGPAGRFAVLFAVTGLMLPGAMRWPLRIWLRVGEAMGFVVLRAILLASYYLIISPVALWFRLIGRDILHLRARSCTSFWQPYNADPFTRERYRRLF